MLHIAAAGLAGVGILIAITLTRLPQIGQARTEEAETIQRG